MRAGSADMGDVADLLRDSVLVRDLDGRITYWNPAAEALYGWTREQAIGAEISQLLKCRHEASPDEREAELLSTGQWEGDLSRTTASGADILVETYCSIRRDAAGAPVDVVDVSRDATARRKADETLQLAEARFRNLFDHMPIAIWQLDTRGGDAVAASLDGVTDLRAYAAAHPEMLKRVLDAMVVSDANNEAVRLLGAKDREQLFGPMTRFWTDMDQVLAATEQRLRGKQSYSGIAKLNSFDGRQVDVLFSIAAAAALGNRGISLIGAIDITDRRRAIEDLARSEAKYRNLFHYMPLSLWQIDVSDLMPILAGLRAEGVKDLDAYIDAHPDFVDRAMAIMRVQQVNDGTIAMFGGGDPADFVGPIERFWRDSPDTLRRSLVARFGGAASYTEETKVRALDGRLVDVHYASAFPAALGAMGIGLVGAIDIGPRLEAERQLHQVRADLAHAARVATLGELTASIAHEVNQPLAAITTNGEAALRWLSRPEIDVAEVRTLADRMVADARRAADVIARIRAMASPQTGERALLSGNELVEESIRFLRHELLTHGVAVDLALAPDLPAIHADRTQVQQVLINLAVNAVQAMAAHGTSAPRLTFRTAADGGFARFELADNGPGIPAAVAARLFDSFYTTKAGGLGIGLAICRSIIEAHGGEIGIVDGADGACFRFTLPAADLGTAR